MKYFPHRHKLHLFDAGLYGFARFNVCHLILFSILFDCKSHIYLLSSVAFLLSYFLNEALWLEYLVLKEFSVSPIYVCGESALVDGTVA